MRHTQIIVAGTFCALMGAVSASADGHPDVPKVYAYHSSDNYCPTGLQPVTLLGTVSCGEPNQKVTYQQVMAHGARNLRTQTNCPVGTKGCTFD